MAPAEKGILNRNQIKWIAVAAMLVDHIAWVFVPTASLLGQIMHFVGRLTLPTMAFFVAEGYFYTRSIKKYIFRMGIFAIISWPAFAYFETGRFPLTLQGGNIEVIPYFGVIYSLFLGLLAIHLWNQDEFPIWVRITGIALLCILSKYGDGSYFVVIWCLLLYVYRRTPKQKWLAFSAVGIVYCMPILCQTPWWSYLFMIGIFAVPFLIQFGYNGKPGRKTAFNKWFFYVIYPLHLIVLGVLRWRH